MQKIMRSIPKHIREIVPFVPSPSIDEIRKANGLPLLVRLSSNENPLGASPLVSEVLRRELPTLHRYPDAHATELRRDLAEHLDVSSDSLVIGAGSDEVVDFLLRSCCIAGDAIATAKGAFITYKMSAQAHGVRTLEAAMSDERRFDLSALLEQTRADERVKLVFIANPNNPTGTYVNKNELILFLDQLAEIRSGSVLAVLDYAYWEYVTAPDLPDPMEILRLYPNVVVLRTFSKIHGLAALRVGYGVGSPELMAQIGKVRKPFNVNAIALLAARVALSDPAFVTRSQGMNEEGKLFWQEKLTKIGVPYTPTQANFILVDVEKGLGLKGVEACRSSLKQGVVFQPVSNYGWEWGLRISIGTPEENQIAARVLDGLRVSL